MTADLRGDPAGALHFDLLDLATDTRVRRLVRGRRGPAPPTRRTRVAALLIGAAAMILPAAVVRFGPARHAPYQLLVSIPGRVIPAAELPPVEPVQIRSFDPDTARVFNATVPFSTNPNPAARPFRPAGGADDLARATDCLAAAAYYEAGDDPAGQRAVAQVVLNRVRHPAFPKTVCGVVFQGSERTTGCQFTFTCDGSLVRYTPTPDAWGRARAVAAAALKGTVDRTVGYATHYHTDWVVPYWQASLDKIVAVHTQLFYRWTGWWGTPPAFNRRAEDSEPTVPALARLSDAHRLGLLPEAIAGGPETAGGAGTPQPAVPGVISASDDTPVNAGDATTLAASLGRFMVTLPTGLPPARWPDFANHLCGARERCSVMAWRTKAATATSVPLELTQIAAMQFSYLRDRAFGLDRSLWNCRETPRPDPHQCMKRQMPLPGFPVRGDATPPVDAAAASSNASGSSPAARSADLPAIRRKVDADTASAGAGVPAQPATAAGSKTGRGAERHRPVTQPGTSPAAAP